MNGVYFNDIHSYQDLNLILSPFTPVPAVPRVNFLTVPGRDGNLDLSEANGEIKYDSREFLFTFTVAPMDNLTFDERASMVANTLNGKVCKITVERDPDYYWVGRCSIDSYEQEKNIGKITVKATVDPYKLKHRKTVVSFSLSAADQLVVLENGRMAAVPVINCTNAGVVVLFGGKKYNLLPGENKNLDIRFVEGRNFLTLSGTGTITFTWQEGAL